MKRTGPPRPGVCDECGHAVVRSPLAPPRDGWLNGHLYRKTKLKAVLCSAHGGREFEVSPGVRKRNPFEDSCF